MTTNYSLYSIPAYWTLAFIPKFYALHILSKSNIRIHNLNPRSGDASAKYKRGLSAVDYARYERGEAAHANAFESAGFWVAAVLGGNFVGLGVGALNYYSAAFLILRTARTIAYLTTDSPKLTGLRSFFWGIATMHALALLVQAANKLAMES